MESRIRNILMMHGKVPADSADVDIEANLYELGLTSHASVNVMLALEDEFEIEFPDEALKKSTFATIDSIQRVVGDLVSTST
ncbi:aminoacyl carrier protein [Mycobacterium antarcticum]|uniref:acyl carrier protein n=1 Tax=unclassified Mycolicibacterium TaxID=2636767 RepID=UPI00239A73A0|nr:MULTISPECIES: acyl carrier protein [unclassified Mycolicibacterium]BDX34494.1 aminoacyl carrier protein [Mycolicibacterium sp. TUM20985]GLP77698.1 aminoacyl carrier protein [Mycolicibacterium sp. TUM20983]GLP81902.1 aminoacyl carrier protein [Mycolicibacterium sp. TUM20984]